MKLEHFKLVLKLSLTLHLAPASDRCPLSLFIQAESSETSLSSEIAFS